MRLKKFSAVFFGIAFLISFQTSCEKKLVYPTIHEAINAGDLEDVRRHLKKPENLSIKSSKGSTPLSVAAARGNEAIVSFLLSKGADVNAKDADGGTPLLAAVYFDRIEMVKLLVIQGAEVYVTNGAGLTPLHAAILQENVPIVEFLLNNKAIVNDSDPLNAPLHFAIVKGNEAIVKLLLDKGAWANVRNSMGVTYLTYAEATGKFAIANLLRQYGAK